MKPLDSTPTPSSHDPNRIEAEAMAWFFAQRERELSSADKARFQAWLEEPEHAKEYALFEKTWTVLGEFPKSAQSDSPSLERTHPAVQQQRPGHQSRFPQLRWQQMVIAAACTFTLAIGWLSYEHVAIDFETVVNGPGETKEIALADGSLVRINVNTRLTVRYTLARREVRLEQGEVFIDAAADRRPLTVSAGSSRITDIGTEFNVLALPSLLEIGVRSGHVELTPDVARVNRVYQLHPGDSISWDRSESIDTIAKVTHNSPSSIGTWREGILIVHAEPLSRIVSKLTQYHGPRVELSDERVAARLVSGTIDLRNLEGFWRSLPDILPGLRLRFGTDGTITVSQIQGSSKPSPNM